MQNEPLVGYGKASICPDWPIGLLGFGTQKTRVSIGSKTDIFAIALAITDTAGDTALIVSLDSAGGDDEYILRPMIENKFGIPQDHVIVSAIHQHSTPDWTPQYQKLLLQQVEKAVAAALADRAPAQMRMGKTQTTALTFVRNYICNDGSCWGPNYGSKKSGIKCHESQADEEMRLLQFQREGKMPVLLVNFQAHPLKGAGSQDPYIHGDWPAVMRQELTQQLGTHVIYLSGASGNLNSTSAIPEENISTDWIHHGRRAAETVAAALEHLKPAKLGKIRAKEITKEYETDHSMDHLVPIAQPVYDLYVSDFAAAKQLAATIPQLHSVYHAKCIVSKSQTPRMMERTLSAVSIGDVVFTAHPYEMFDANGVELRNGTLGNENYEPQEQRENPFPMTVVCTLANGHIGYVPSRLGYINGGYSTDITRFAPGGGERLVADYLRLLSDLWQP